MPNEKNVGPLRIDGGRSASGIEITPIWSGEPNLGPLRVNDPGRTETGPAGLPAVTPAGSPQRSQPDFPVNEPGSSILYPSGAYPSSAVEYPAGITPVESPGTVDAAIRNFRDVEKSR